MTKKNTTSVLAIIICCLLFLTGCDDELFEMKDSKKIKDRTPAVADRAASAAAIKVFKLINMEREKQGLYTLEWNETLGRVARMHSLDQAKREELTHHGSNGSDVGKRTRDAGVRWVMIGENVGRNKGFGNPGAIAVEEWMKSPGHRRNIMRSGWTETGIGEVVSNQGFTYFTQIFCQRSER